MPRNAGRIPRSWNELLDRLAYCLGGDGPEFQAEAREWIRQALSATWGIESLHVADRGQRTIAFQKASGVLLALEDEGEMLPFQPGLRERIQREFARCWGGIALDGPPWRITPFEDRPRWRETVDDFA